MNINQIKNYLKETFGDDFNTETLLEQIKLSIDKINEVEDMKKEPKEAALEMLKNLHKTVKFGNDLNQPTISKQKRSNEAFKQMAKNATDKKEDEKQIKFYNDLARACADQKGNTNKWKR